MKHNAQKTGSLAVSAALLAGGGAMAVAAPATASTPASVPNSASASSHARVGTFTKAHVNSALIVHRSGKIGAKASLAAAPKAVPAKKAKKRYKSRRS